MNTKPIIDHTGIKHKSIKAMCKHWGISRETFNRRIRSGNYTLEQALTTPTNMGGLGKQATDHLGNTYPSQSEMCRAYNISAVTFAQRIHRGRLKQGIPLEQALTKSTQEFKHIRLATDHLGNKYTNTSEMCKVYKIPLRIFADRIARGMTLEQALTTPIQTDTKHITEPAIDHLGNKYESVTEMCKAYNIWLYTFKGRLERGMTLEQALTTPVRTRKANIIKDFLGKEYTSTMEMCKAYKIGVATFRWRIKNGMTLEQALTTPSQATKPVTDHLGKEYPSTMEMCKAYNIKETTYICRLRRGSTLEQALTTPLQR